jgi:hypothetical protein
MFIVEVVDAEYGSEWDLQRWACLDLASALQYAAGIARAFLRHPEAPRVIRILHGAKVIEEGELEMFVLVATSWSAPQQSPR